MSTEGQRSYTKGLIDGIWLSPLFGAPDDGDKIQTFATCLEGMTDTQIAAITEKFLKDHPERWNEYLNTVMFSAIRRAAPTSDGASMPEITVSSLQTILDLILDLKARQEIAESKLKSLGSDPGAFAEERTALLHKLQNLPTAS